MKWSYLAVAGALMGGVALVVRRRNNKALAEADLWAQATDPVARFGS